jgi:homoserine dehydrogenase
MKVQAGLVGFGVIGAGVVKLLEEHAELLRLRSGVQLTLSRIVDVDLTRDRGVSTGAAQLSSDFRDVTGDPEIDIVIELVGGTTVARQVVEQALRAGKHVVTANKALLSAHGSALFEIANEAKREIRFEASVGGGIPIVRVITESLASDRIHTIFGIVNGTTNFILTRMIDDAWSFADALKQAQKLGFAEADPTLDINGDDAKHKLGILATVAFNAEVDKSFVYTEGITELETEDVQYAKDLGYVVKLLGIAKQTGDTMILRVHPTLIPEDCALANVRNEFNAVMLRSEFLGDSLYVGRGAGAHPTATAVVADVTDLAMTLLAKQQFNPNRYRPFNQYRTVSHLEAESRFYLRTATDERAGILAVITRILADHQISISAIIQKEAPPDRPIPIVLLTRLAREQDVRLAVAKINELDFVKQKTRIMHIEDIEL